MDHNLEDSLNLESAMGMDFESTDAVSHADISLDAVPHESDITMEFERIQEQPILMDSLKEEIIDFMDDQFNLQEYSIQDDQAATVSTSGVTNEQSILMTQSETMVDLQYEPQAVTPKKQEVKIKPKYIAVKQAAAGRGAGKKETAGARLVAIAPKLPRLVPARPLAPPSATYLQKIPLAGVTQGLKGNTVLAQIGKQFLMVPSSSSQKIKVVSASNTAGVSTLQYIKAGTDQAQLIPAKTISGIQPNKPIMAKLILQGQQSGESAVLTKLGGTRYALPQQAVPISIRNKVLMGSPTKQGIKFTKKQQVIAIKSPSTTTASSSAGPMTKKVVISANPSQNVILKTTAPPKAAQITKDGKVVVQGQRSQLHQINVPGKGIQYIRLITNQTPVNTKTVVKSNVTNIPKTFVLADNKVQTSRAAPQLQSVEEVTPTYLWSQKLVTISADELKSTPSSPATSRSSQSLLAPLSPSGVSVKLEGNLAYETHSQVEPTDLEATIEECPEDQSHYDAVNEYEDRPPEPIDSKSALQALVADAVSSESSQIKMENETNNMIEHLVPVVQSEEHPLIVISSNYISQDSNAQNEQSEDDSGRLVNMDGDMSQSFASPTSPPDPSESDVLGLKPRRACNCTKSQCLKLYCDCFANGEFCYRCNCNNCHNNLDHEELRQKAIRACLERNPNAFRPKIGKSKTGGPEIIRRHNKGCNCKRSGCLKNYCECFEAKIACTSMCKCVGCRNVEDAVSRRRAPAALYRPPPLADCRQPCTFMTTEVIEAVCQCLIAASSEGNARGPDRDPVRDVIEEFARCLQDVVSAAHHAPPPLHEGQA